MFAKATYQNVAKQKLFTFLFEIIFFFIFKIVIFITYPFFSETILDRNALKPKRSETFQKVGALPILHICHLYAILVEKKNKRKMRKHDKKSSIFKYYIICQIKIPKISKRAGVPKDRCSRLLFVFHQSLGQCNGDQYHHRIWWFPSVNSLSCVSCESLSYYCLPTLPRQLFCEFRIQMAKTADRVSCE